MAPVAAATVAIFTRPEMELERFAVLRCFATVSYLVFVGWPALVRFAASDPRREGK